MYSRKQINRARKEWVRTLIAQDRRANQLTLWSDLGYCLNRWSPIRIGAAVGKARGRNAMGQVLATLARQPKLLHLPKGKAAA